MSKKFYTADWHLSSQLINRVYKRPFNGVLEMNARLIDNCNAVASSEDIVVHLGDFLIYGNDHGEQGLKISPQFFLNKINATFVNVEGNHDPTNKTKSIGWFFQTHLGNVFPDVSIAHWPSYHEKMQGLIKPGWIHLCGHVHSKWKHYYDAERQVLNINVGVDVWDFKPVPESTLVSYIKTLLSKHYGRNQEIKNN